MPLCCCFLVSLLLLSPPAVAQRNRQRLPVIDMHLHAFAPEKSDAYRVKPDHAQSFGFGYRRRAHAGDARRDAAWVPEENLYIRYEDVIVVTADGYENFTDFLPTELNELEKLVGQGGIALKLQPAPEKDLIKRQ